MCHTECVRSAEIVRALRAHGMTQQELARRAGVARETLSRWESGAQQPSLESLDRVAAAAGAKLDVRLLAAEAKLVELVNDQLDLGPTGGLKALLGASWPVCRDALVAAAGVGDVGVLVGPVAAALSGAPQRPVDNRVDVLVAPEDVERAFDRLFAVDAWPDGFEQVAGGGERRERWRRGRGSLTVRTMATGVQDIGAIRDRAHRVALSRRGETRGVRVALVEDLLAIAERSPWSEDAIYREGLRAVLASERYWSREHDEHRCHAA